MHRDFRVDVAGTPHRVAFWVMTGLLLALGIVTDGAGIGLEGNRVNLDLGQAVPGQPLIWPGSAQLSVFADTPWHLSIKAETDLHDGMGHSIPVDRLSWSLADDTGAWGTWHPLSQQEQQVLAGKTPTESDGQQLALGYRFCGSWDDPVGGPFTTTIQANLVAGVELVPAYVWPQPYVVGDGGLHITYWAGGLAEGPSFPTRLLVRDTQGLLVAEVTGLATPGAWASIEWSGQAIDGQAVEPGDYAYVVVDAHGVPLAQGLVQVVHAVTSSIRGTVSGEVWASGERVAGATVTLFTGARRQIGSVTTDSDGRFAFGDLGEGTYLLEVSCPGYLSWSGELFALDPGTPDHREMICLEPNNALFVVASAQALGVDSQSASRGLHTLVAGEVVQVQGHVYNSGTRHLRNIVVTTHWPSFLQPLSEDGGSVSLLRIPELAPGQSAGLHFSAVCGLPTAEATGTQNIVVRAEAWAVTSTDDDLELVQSPPRYLGVGVRDDGSRPSGVLAFFAFWDSDGDGRFSPQEAPAVGVHLRVGPELPNTTNQDGWLVQRVHPGPIGIYQPPDERGASEHPVLAALVRPGEVLVFRLAVAPDGRIRVTDGQASQAILGWSDQQGGSRWQGAGDLAVTRGEWSGRWSLPSRFEVVRHGDHDQGLSEQRWLADVSTSRPLLAWGCSANGKPAPGGRSDSLSFSTVLDKQPVVFRREWAANGSGPYHIGVPIHAVHAVQIMRGTQRVHLSEAEYTWSPQGLLWLARPPQAWVGYGLEGPARLVVDYTPLNADGERFSVPSWGITARGRPRCEEPGSVLVEEFGLNWRSHDPLAEDRSPLWRVSWERRLPDGKWYWEGGTLASPGKDPAGELSDAYQPPSIQPLPVEGVESVWPPYVRIEGQRQRDAWLVSTGHERRGLWRRQQVTVSRELPVRVTGRWGLQLARWAEPSTDGGQASLVMQVKQQSGNWQWRLNQRVTLVEMGSPRPTCEACDEHCGVDDGSLTLSYANDSIISPQFGVHVDTRSGQAWADFDQVLNLGSSVQASVGGTTHRGGIIPRARVKWRPVEIGLRTLPQEHDSGVQVDVVAEGRAFGAAWRGVYTPPHQTQLLRWCYTRPLGVGSLLSARLQGKVAQPEGTRLWEADVVWTGEMKRLAVPWHVSAQLQFTHSSLDRGHTWASYAAAGGSIRRPFGQKTAVAAGGTWPCVATSHQVQQEKHGWVALERQLAGWSSQALWGSVELHFGTDGVRPGIHFALR